MNIENLVGLWDGKIMLNGVEIYHYKDKCSYETYTVYVKKFRDLDDFLKSICDTDINKLCYRMSSVNGSKDFTGTNSYEEAWNLCRFTMNEGFEDFSNLLNKLSYILDSDVKKQNSYSVVGYMPSVPRFLQGLPTNMHNYTDIIEYKKINIYMNIAYSSRHTHEQIINRGICVLNLIKYLENRGFKVNFYTYDICKEGEITLIVVPLKLVNEVLNIKKVYFPLVHPSFLRRLIFRAQELLPLTDRDYYCGYGIPMNYEAARSFFEKYDKSYDDSKTIYISTPEELGIYGEDIKSDFDSFIENINNKYNLFDDEKELRR